MCYRMNRHEVLHQFLGLDSRGGYNVEDEPMEESLVCLGCGNAWRAALSTCFTENET